MRIKYDQLQTKTCGAEEDGDHEQNRSPTFKSLQMDMFFFLLLFVSTRVRDFLDIYSLKRGSDVRNCQR